MATKKDMTKQKLQAGASGDAVVYKVMIALALLCAALTGLRALRGYYATIGGHDLIYPMTGTLAIIGFALAAVCALVTILLKNRIARAIMPWFMTLGLLVGIMGLDLQAYWTDDFTTLYFLCCAILAQYIIYQLYRWEFFLVSLSTVICGFAYYSFSRGLVWNARNLLLVAAAVIVLAGSAAVALLAAKNRGVLVLAGKKLPVFPAKFTPMLICIVDALWLVCLILSVVLGSLFAYYCMFVAIAVEFIAAVYYTFQLN